MPADKQPWTAAELEQLRVFVTNFHLIANRIPPGTRELLKAHGFHPGRIHAIKRSTYRLAQALKEILEPAGRAS